MILTETSVELARAARTLTPYFFSKAALTGRTSWLMIWVVYQTTSPSFGAAAIRAAAAPCAQPPARLAAQTAAAGKRRPQRRRAMAFSPEPAATAPPDLFRGDSRQFETAVVTVGQRPDRRQHLRREQADVLLRQMRRQRAELQHADELLEAHTVVAFGDAAAHRVGAAADHDAALDQLLDLHAAPVPALGGERALERFRRHVAGRKEHQLRLLRKKHVEQRLDVFARLVHGRLVGRGDVDRR